MVDFLLILAVSAMIALLIFVEYVTGDPPPMK
jgi:hypothetical protein